MVVPDVEIVTEAEAELEADALAVPFIAVIDAPTEEEEPAELDADPLAEDDAAAEDEAVVDADVVSDTGTGPPAPLMPRVMR